MRPARRFILATLLGALTVIGASGFPRGGQTACAETGAGAAAASSGRSALRLSGADGRIALDPLVRGMAALVGLRVPASTRWSIDVAGLVEELGLERLTRLSRGVLAMGLDEGAVALRLDTDRLHAHWNDFTETLAGWSRAGARQAAEVPRWALTWLGDEGERPVQEPQRIAALEGTDAVAVVRPDASPASAVLLVHGLDEPGWIWDDLAPALRAEGHAPVRFDYPNDGPIATAADSLGAALETLRRCGVEEVDVVAHSMGGLVVRDVLTRCDWYGGAGDGDDRLPCVKRVVFVGTPHQGVEIARAQALSELKEHAIRLARRTGTIDGPVHDGRGEAARDLLPDSAFLTDLKSRPRPEGVHLTVIVGQLPTPSLPSGLVDRLPAAPRASVQRTTTRVAHWVGDGLVRVDAALLPEADETHVLEGNHHTLLRRWRPGMPQPPAVPVILEALRRCPTPGVAAPAAVVAPVPPTVAAPAPR